MNNSPDDAPIDAQKNAQKDAGESSTEGPAAAGSHTSNKMTDDPAAILRG